MRPSKHSEDSRLYYDWLEMAARDLLAARLLIEQGQCLEIAGFHCQQCREKTLKAYLIAVTGRLVDGHNLTWLLRQAIRARADFRTFMDDAAEMNRLYIEARYPSDRELTLSAEEADSMRRTAEAVYTAVCDEIYDSPEAEED